MTHEQELQLSIMNTKYDLEVHHDAKKLYEEKIKVNASKIIANKALIETAEADLIALKKARRDAEFIRYLNTPCYKYYVNG